MIYDVQFGSADESKVYSLGEDKMFCLWNASLSDVPLMKMHCKVDPCQLPPTVALSTVFGSNHLPFPTSGRNKLFGSFCAYKYLLISSSEEKVLCKVQ